ncbi:MAG TPA: M23 family metallopeptidase [Lutibacter sp.]|nr:M23 family metallopeptidase [Lutibacter sp.]
MAKKNSKLRQKLTYKYRMVVLNEDTFEERFSFKLSRLNVYVFGGLSIIILIALTSLLIAFTPLREYVPGYSSTALKEKATDLTYQLDSLENIYKTNDIKLNAMLSIIKGDEDIGAYQKRVDSIIEISQDSNNNNHLYASKADSVFRENIDKQDRDNINSKNIPSINKMLFSPVSGTITNHFNSDKKHYAIDIATKKDAPIKTIADGTIIFSEWSVDTGYVILVDHGSNLISVYKHNSQLYKKQGDMVKSGEVIASAGTSGELSTGVHLHFELWYNGYPIDPTNFMDFK